MKETLPLDFELRLKEILPQRPLSMTEPLGEKMAELSASRETIFEPRPFQTFRINTLKTSVEEAHDWLSRQKIIFRKADFCPYAVTVDASAARQVLDSDLVKEGLLYAQGLESLLAVVVLDPRPHESVLDMCAAPGGKTSQIAMHMGNTGRLVANEPVRERLYKLKAVLALTGARAQICSVDGRRLWGNSGLFDRILVDAPCSCEGRFIAGQPKSFAYWSVRKIKEMSHKQKGLLWSAARLLAPGGTLVYATCTFAPEENEEVVDFVLRKSEGRLEFVPVRLEGVKSYPCLTQWGKRKFDASMESALRVLPDERMEGFFIAKFKNCHYK